MVTPLIDIPNHYINNATEAIYIIEHPIGTRGRHEGSGFSTLNSYSAAVTDSYDLRRETDVVGYHYPYTAWHKCIPEQRPAEWMHKDGTWYSRVCKLWPDIRLTFQHNPGQSQVFATLDNKTQIPRCGIDGWSIYRKKCTRNTWFDEKIHFSIWYSWWLQGCFQRTQVQACQIIC